MLKGETIISIFFLILAIYLLHITFQLPIPSWVVVGPHVWPAILLIGMIFSCIGIIYNDMITKKYVTPEKISRNEFIRLIGTLMFMFSYSILLDILGFLLSTLILFPIYLRFMNVKLWKSIMVGILFAIFALLLFQVVIMAYLPRGQGIFYYLTSYILNLFSR
ncbi:MAG: tripartite tricarboxylate transporter TctB family protein [Candidatus Methanomethylicia archaeon]